jgi:hypothetical protein
MTLGRKRRCHLIEEALELALLIPRRQAQRYVLHASVNVRL